MKRDTTEEFIEKAKLIHGDRYDYSKVEYIKSCLKVIIICPEHGEFEQRANGHLKGQGCPICAKLSKSKNYIKTIANKKEKYLLEKEEDNTKHIPIKENVYAIIDIDDFEKVNNYNWSIKSCGNYKYANNEKAGLMHRFILNITSKEILVDHINHNTLDNRKENLRTCSHKENCTYQQIQNTTKSSKYKGVYWDKDRNKWSAGIKFNQKRIFLGRFDDEVEAAKAYDNKALELFKEFAYLNFR